MEELLLLQAKVQHLVEAYAQLKKETADLKNRVEAQKQENAQMYQNIIELRNQNKELQMANALLGDAEQRLAAKQQLTQMIKKLDKSLSVLTM